MVDLDAFMAECKSALQTDDPAAVVETLVRKAIANPDALHAAFGERIRGKSLRDRIVYHDDSLTVLQVATVPGLQSPVHNHNMWAVIGVYEGEEYNAFFEETDDGLKQTGEKAGNNTRDQNPDRTEVQRHPCLWRRPGQPRGPQHVEPAHPGTRGLRDRPALRIYQGTERYRVVTRKRTCYRL